MTTISTRYFILVLLLFWLDRILFCSSLEINLKFGYISSEEILTQKSGTSLQQCYEECQTYPNLCTGISYGRRHLLCNLHKSSGQPPSLVKDKNFVYSNASSWLKNVPPPCDKKQCGDNQLCSYSPNTNQMECISLYCFEPEQRIHYSTLLGTRNTIGSKRINRCHGTSETESKGALSICMPNGTWVTEDIKCLPFSEPYLDQYMINRWDIPIQTFNDTSRAECIMKCYEDIQTCEYANYHATNRRCHTSNGHTLYTLKPEPGWEAIPKVFPVVIHRSSSGKSYDLNHSTASDRCKELGTRMANRADVEMAHGMGYSRCICGFVVEDIYSIISMRYFVLGCVNVGVNKCKWLSDSGDVFCINTNFFHS